MSFDPLLSDLFLAHEERHKELDYTPDMERIAAALGRVKTGEHSFLTASGEIVVESGLKRTRRREDLAHEASHALAAELIDDQSYVKAIQYHHAHVPDMDAHLERLADHGSLHWLAPREMVDKVLEVGGLNAGAVWRLHQTAEIQLHMALKRIVTFDEDGRRGGFIAQHGRIIHASSYQYYLRCWVGDDVPDEGSFQGSGVSLYQVPGYPSMCIGLVIADD
ncbi:hypothetical protein [Deinococcus sp. QL22]|uniref:hypothetical protein n=1 Tax=Deinococcus sp. QL22 TaxID=2939437 RepID=UPI0020172D00|nr:hypothetical protein [Deinococcus sp. QL22]UQN06805.1 hypothetical protein M1R55_02455 [Deinococcus sp. QL22]